MTEKELGKALLNLSNTSAPGAPDPRGMTQKILDRDRRRIRLLAGLAVLFWVLTTAGVVSLCPFYIMYLAPRLRSYQAGRSMLQNDWEAWASLGEYLAYWVLACVISLLFAALCTVLLVLLSRRATLRQINASLAEISGQLRQAGQPPSLATRGATDNPE